MPSTARALENTNTLSVVAEGRDTPDGVTVTQLLAGEVADGSVDAVHLDGSLESIPFAVGLAALCRSRQALRVGGSLRISVADAEQRAHVITSDAGLGTRQRAMTELVAGRDGCFRDKLRRTLVGLGFRVTSLVDTKSEIHVEATATVTGALDGAVLAAKALIQEISEERFDDDWSQFLEALPGVEPPLRDSGIVPLSQIAPTVSIIVLTYNQLGDTKLCLDSIVARTRTPHELIIVDNGSSDGTPDYLRSWAAERHNVKLILNADNRGFAGGNNLGLSIAKGRYVVLLNNDTIVTDGWLERMTAVCERNPSCGLVGPRSNYVSGAQLVRDTGYGSVEEMHDYAARWGAQNDGQDEQCIRLVGFCLLARREVVEAIGGLDERFGRGNFEDDDFCLRALVAGFEARIAHDTFIHHTGHRSFIGAGIDLEAELEKNWSIFKDKWGIDPARRRAEGLPNEFQAPDAAAAAVALPDLEAYDHEGRVWATPQPTTHPAIAAFEGAERLATDGRWDDACEAFRALVKAFPTFGPGYVGLASAAFAIGALQDGMEALEHACGIYPDNPGLRMQLGVVRAHIGDLQGAQAAFIEVLDLDADNIDALVSLAQLCRATRHFVEAVDILDHAARIAPDNPTVMGAVAATAKELGDDRGAKAALQRMEQIAPDHSETAYVRQLLATS